MSVQASIVWFRQGLGLEDNPALCAAVPRGGPVAPVFVWAPGQEGAWPLGAASRWWLQQSLQSLEAALQRRGSRLIICRGDTTAALQALIHDTGATSIYWSRRYEPK